MTPPSAASARPALVVLGPPAAGADVIARVLAAAGAAQRGESGLAAWSAQALATRGSHADDLFGPKGGAGGGDAGEIQALSRVLAETGAAEDGAPLLLTEPGAAFLAELWAGALRGAGLRPVFVIPVADPAECAAALKAEHGFTRARGLLLWTSHLLRAERATRGERRVFVDIARLQADPESELDRVERALGARLPHRSWDAAAAVEDLVHAHAKARAQGVGALPPALAPVRTLHAHLQAAAQDAPENADVAAEVGGWFDALEQAVAPVLKELERELRAKGPGVAATASGSQTPAAEPEEDARDAQLAELDQALKSARRDLSEALDRAHALEAQASIAEAQVAVGRRRSAEAEELLQARLVEAQTHEREARAALVAAVSAREAAEAHEQAAVAAAERAREASEARERAAAADARAAQEASAASARADAADALNEALAMGRRALSEARAEAAEAQAAALRAARQEHEGRMAALRDHLEAVSTSHQEEQARVREQAEAAAAANREAEAALREQLERIGVSNLAAQARVRELESRLADAQARSERGWWRFGAAPRR